MTERIFRNSSYLNSMSTSGTRTRVRDVSPTSGMCPTCISECPILCEISLSSFRGREVLYPSAEYFGQSTAASLKDYGLDWSHFNIMSRLRGAEGIEPESDVALFPNVDIETKVIGIPVKLPMVTGAYGSTAVAKNYWDGLSVGAAISGVPIVIGENVCGMDPQSKFAAGKVTHSQDMSNRVKKYREFWDGTYGDIIIQTNVEDQRLGVDEYALSKLEANVIERKWGQGAKAIGGEVRLNTLERALLLKQRGYIVIPDPEDEIVQAAFKSGVFKTFERHSRVGMPSFRGFIEDVDWLRDRGAKKVTIKTGAYRPAAVAWTLKVASEARVDGVVFDGAGGGTGMSPVPMMNEMSTPTVYLEAQVLKCCKILEKKGRYIPDILMAGGFISETQIFKSLALSNFDDNPYVKAIVTARAPLTAVMKSEYFVKLGKEGKLPRSFTDLYGTNPEKFFGSTPELKNKFDERFADIPWSAVGLYTYLIDRIGVGLQQLLAGARKFSLNLINRDDLATLSERAQKVTGITLMEEFEKDVVENILE